VSAACWLSLNPEAARQAREVEMQQQREISADGLL
jgi:hypothetical protein